MLLFVLDAMIGTGWDQVSETATAGLKKPRLRGGISGSSERSVGRDQHFAAACLAADVLKNRLDVVQAVTQNTTALWVLRPNSNATISRVFQRYQPNPAFQ